jgi:hypothetical protein
LWHDNWRRAAFAVLIAAAIAYVKGFKAPFYVMNFCVVALMLTRLCLLAFDRPHRRMARLTRHFETVTRGRIVLHFAPEIGARTSAFDVLERVESALIELEILFAAKLGPHTRWPRIPSLPPRPLRVYLFPSGAAVNDCYHMVWGLHVEVGGFALPIWNSVVLTADDRILDESIRHELTHLFTIRADPNSPPLFTEGLATWLQENIGGVPIHAIAARWPKARHIRLRPLLDPKTFHRGPDRHASYVLAGSFTGYLLQRYGWPTYFAFYRQAVNGSLVRAKFRWYFGRRFEDVEKDWRREVLAKFGSDVPVSAQ